MKVPDKLRLFDNGLIACEWGEAEAYLAKWFAARGMTNGEPVCVIRRDDLQHLFDELNMQRERILCA